MKRLAGLALVLLAGCGSAAQAVSTVSVKVVYAPYGSRALDVSTDCADPLVSTPYSADFNPGGPTFDVLADTPGTYTVRCDGQVLVTKVMS